MKVEGSSGKRSRVQTDYPSVMNSEQLLAVWCRNNFTAVQQVFSVFSVSFLNLFV